MHVSVGSAVWLVSERIPHTPPKDVSQCKECQRETHCILSWRHVECT